MPRIPHFLIIVAVFSIALCAAARSDEGVTPPSPPSVSCLGPEAEGYLKDLLARILQLEDEIDAEKQARVADQERAARMLSDRAGEQAQRAAVIDEQARTRAADLAAVRQECEQIKAASAGREELEKRLASTEAALNEARDARRKAEEETAAAKRAARREASAREQVERLVADLERRVNGSGASPSGAGDAPATAKSERIDVAPEPRVADEDVSPSTGRSEREIAAEQLAMLTGKKARPARSERVPDPSEPQVAQRPSKDDEERALRLAGDPRAERELAAKQRAALFQSAPAAPSESPPIAPEPQAGPAPQVDRLAAARARASEGRSYSVEGWVATPGTYELTEGSTLTSAIETAGGKLFPGQIDQVEIRHAAGGNEARVEIINAEKIIAGKSPDVRLRAGDVVRVPGSVLTAVPWGVVRVVTFPIWYPISLASRGSE